MPKSVIPFSEFLHRRKSSKYKVGDYVYFETSIINPDNHALFITMIDIGQVIYTEDEYSSFYGVRPLSTPKDTWTCISLLPRDMRRLKKSEVKEVIGA